MKDTKQDIDYMYAQGWPSSSYKGDVSQFFANGFYTLQPGSLSFPDKISYAQAIEQSKKSSLLNFVTGNYRTTPNLGIFSGVSKTTGHYSFYREEVVANNASGAVTHRDPVAINVQSPQIIDYNVASNHTYKYTAYPTDMEDTVYATTAVNPNATTSDTFLVQTPMINWSLSELLPVEKTTNIPSVKKEYTVNKSSVWIFRFNVSTGENTQNVGRDQVTNLSQYNKMAQGKRNYMSGTVSCYLGSELVRCTGEYDEEPRFTPLTTSNKSIAMLKAWRRFVSSKNPKLLKDRKGNKYIVQLTSMSDRVDDNVPCQPSYVNFAWQEIESCDNVLITGQNEDDTITTAQGQAVMQTIKLPTPIIHGAAFIGDTIWNTDDAEYEDSYHFIFSIENDALTDYYEWTLSAVNNAEVTGYETPTQTPKSAIAPIILPERDGSGSFSGQFIEGNKYMLRVRGKSNNSSIEPSNYYTQIIECKWLWGPNKYLELQDQYYNVAGSSAADFFATNWGFGGLGVTSNDGPISFPSHSCIVTLGNAYNKNTISNFSITPTTVAMGDDVNVTVTGGHNIVAGDTLYFSLHGKPTYLTSSTLQFLFYRQRADSAGTPQATLIVNSVIPSGENSILNCTVQQGSISSSHPYAQLWSYKIGTDKNEWNTTYPWSEIKRSCGTWQNGYYYRVAYEGEQQFANDGSQGDVFVEYPLFYYADFNHTGSTAPENDFIFPFKYVNTNGVSSVTYLARWVFIAIYPYHYGIPNTGITSEAPKCLYSSLHINYQTEQTYAVGFLSAYEISKINDLYRSVSGQIPVTQESGQQLLLNIPQQQPGLIGLKYTDHNMICILMALEFGTFDINLALSGHLNNTLQHTISNYTVKSCRMNLLGQSATYALFKESLYIRQVVRLLSSSSTELAQIGALVFNDTDQIIDIYFAHNLTQDGYSALRICQWKTGVTDNLPGHTNSLRGPNNTTAPCKYRGLENPFGNVAKLCSDIQVKSQWTTTNERRNYTYYYKNANVITDPSASAGISDGNSYFRSNCYFIPYRSIAVDAKPIVNTDSQIIGTYFVPRTKATVDTVGSLASGSVGLEDSATAALYCGVQIGGPAVFGSNISTGPYNVNLLEQFSNAAFGTRFSTHRTRY